MKKIFSFLLFLFIRQVLVAQVSINNDGSVAGANTMLDVKSTSKGVQFPRMTTPQRKAITTTTDDAGLMVFDTDKQALYMFNGLEWVPFAFANGQQAVTAQIANGSTSVALTGSSCDVSGNYAVVGAPRDSINNLNNAGSAFVYEKVNGVWVQKAQLVASDPKQYGYFGEKVAIDGDYIIVGSKGAAIGGLQGAAYIFVRSNGVWQQQAKISSNDPTPAEEFGAAVDIEGSNVIVGCPSHKQGANTAQGAAYVFTRSGTTWSLLTQLKAADGAAYDHFGFSVSLSGNTFVVGSPDNEVSANFLNQGSVYVYLRTGNSFAQQQKLFFSDVAGDSHFGYSVSIDDNKLVAGMWGYQFTGVVTGAAASFARNGASWTQEKLFLPDNKDNSRYGIAVKVKNGYVAIGAYQENVEGMEGRGAVYFFKTNGTSIESTKRFTHKDGYYNEWFGSGIGFDGTTLIIGAPGFYRTNDNSLAKGGVFFNAIDQ